MPTAPRPDCQLWLQMKALAPNPSPLEQDTLCIRPSLPPAGRLTHFLPFWEKVTSDPWVLKVIRSGYLLEIAKQLPSRRKILTTPLRDGGHVLLEEVAELLGKSAVEPVPPGQERDGFYSTYFLVEKKDGSQRPILNLKFFNRFLRKRTFKMETLQSVISILQPGCWMASVDLKDAYFHIPVAREHRKYLRFKINGVCYQFCVTPFGLSPAPMLFTKVLLVLIAWLRLRGVRLHAYLDDIIILGDSPREVQEALEMTVQVFTSAGFIINLKKSDLTPTQDLVYIGGWFRTLLGRVFLPEDRRESLIRVIRSFKLVGKMHCARSWLQVLGLLAATIPSVHQARLRMRPIQWHVKQRWESRDLTAQIMVTRALLPALDWWTEPKNLSGGRPFQVPPHTITVTTDSSIEGWGGHSLIEGQTFLFSGTWSTQERKCHINLLELRAIRLTLVRLQRYLTNQVVRVECDNTTAVSYLNKQGGTRSLVLCEEAATLTLWALQHNVMLAAVHRPGVDNQLADFLSRNVPDPTEWSLSDCACQRLFSMWGRPQVDLFASAENHKLPTWFSRHLCEGAQAPDALTQAWTGLSVYAFPPLNLIQKTLLKIRDERVEEVILVVPDWPGRPWYPILLQMASAKPVRLRVKIDLLTQKLTGKGVLYHPDLLTLKLTGWRLNGANGAVKA